MESGSNGTNGRFPACFKDSYMLSLQAFSASLRAFNIYAFISFLSYHLSFSLDSKLKEERNGECLTFHKAQYSILQVEGIQ